MCACLSFGGCALESAGMCAARKQQQLMQRRGNWLSALEVVCAQRLVPPDARMGIT
jgi:uncharacterized Fe-S cluster-containing radical SAM superfamily protein